MKLLRFAFLALPIVFASVVGLLSAKANETLDGKKIFMDQKCNMCHTVSSAGIQAINKSTTNKAPDLTGRLEGRDAAQIAKILRKEAKTADGKIHPKAFTGSDEELGALIAWLEQQKKTQ